MSPLASTFFCAAVDDDVARGVGAAVELDVQVGARGP
jgi:hypothetical protein